MEKISSKIIVLAIGASLIFTACGNTKEVVDKSNENPSIEKEVESKEVGNKKQQKKPQRPHMMGRVKSIIGNEVVLELVEMPERQQESGKKSIKGQGNNEGGEKSGKQGGGQKPGGGTRQLKFTGETANITIPVGVPIASASRGEVKELEIADIYEDSILQIYFDNNDKEDKSIVKISVIQGR